MKKYCDSEKCRLQLEYITEDLKLNQEFLLTVFKGKGFSVGPVRVGNVYMHKHCCLEIDLAL